MTDHKPLSEGEIATPEEAAQVQRALGALDGLADLWAMNNDIQGQLRRLLGRDASRDWVGLLLRWTKQAFVEGAYEGRTSATDEVADLKAELASRATPKPLDGEAEELIKCIDMRLLARRLRDQPGDSELLSLCREFLARSTQKEATEEEPERLIREYLAAHPDAALGVIDMRRIWAEHGIRLVKVPHESD